MKRSTCFGEDYGNSSKRLRKVFDYILTYAKSYSSLSLVGEKVWDHGIRACKLSPKITIFISLLFFHLGMIALDVTSGLTLAWYWFWREALRTRDWQWEATLNESTILGCCAGQKKQIWDNGYNQKNDQTRRTSHVENIIKPLNQPLIGAQRNIQWTDLSSSHCTMATFLSI